MLLFLAGDVRWSGQMTEQAQFLGRTLRFSTTWIVLASLSEAPVVIVYCRIGPDRRITSTSIRPSTFPKTPSSKAKPATGYSTSCMFSSSRSACTPPIATTTCSGTRTRTRWPELSGHADACQRGGNRFSRASTCLARPNSAIIQCPGVRRSAAVPTRPLDVSRCGGRGDGHWSGAGGAVSVATGPNPLLYLDCLPIQGQRARRSSIKGLESPRLSTFLMLETGRDLPRQAA